MTSFYRNRFGLLSSVALSCFAWALPALAAPEDVLQAPKAAEPLGQLKPEDVLRRQSTPELLHHTTPPPPSEAVDIPTDSGIFVTDSRSSIDRFGTMQPEMSGYAENIWQYLDEQEARSLVEAIPGAIRSPALQDAFRRLMLTEANPPRNTQSGWLELRASTLLRLGNTQDASLLLDAVPQSLREGSLQNTYLLAMLLSRQTDKACITLDTILEKNKKISKPLDRMSLFCKALKGDYSAAELAINVKSEAGTPYPSWFVSLIESLGYDNTRMSAMPKNPEELDIAMILAAGGNRLPKTLPYQPFLDTGYSMFLPTLALQDWGNPLGQTTLLEALLRSHPTAARPLAASYEALATPALKPSITDRGLAYRVEAYSKLSAAKNQGAALQAFDLALKAFWQKPSIATQVLLVPLIAITQTMHPNQPYLEFAPQAFRILMQNNKKTHVVRWLQLMDHFKPNDPATYVSHEIARFADNPSAHLSPDSQNIPPFTIPEKADKKMLRVLQRYYHLMPLFGYQVPEITLSLLDEMLPTADNDSTPWNVDEIQDYTDRGSIAGVILAAAALHHESGWMKMDDASLIVLIESVLRLGDGALAQKLAVESLLALM